MDLRRSLLAYERRHHRHQREPASIGVYAGSDANRAELHCLGHLNPSVGVHAPTFHVRAEGTDSGVLHTRADATMVHAVTAAARTRIILKDVFRVTGR
jgi:hypothetical protein